MLSLSEVEGKKDTYNIGCSEEEQLTSTALNKAIIFRSEYPFFLLVMKESFINGYYLVSILLNTWIFMSYVLL